MNEPELIAAVKRRDAASVRALIDAGVDVDAQGPEHGWSALKHAAGLGDLALVKLLFEHGGADPTLTGTDRRTPYDVAVAAGRRDVARYLACTHTAQMDGRGAAKRPYSRAYLLAALRTFPGWSPAWEDPGSRTETVVYVHHDLSVTRSMFHGQDVVPVEPSPQWEAFCREVLGFEVPDDFALMSSAPPDTPPPTVHPHDA